MKLFEFIRLRFDLQERDFTFFFKGLFLTTILAYANQIIPFLPGAIIGFNWSGIAWIVMLLVTLVQLARSSSFTFPIMLWLPWGLYILVYILFDFSFIGLQLTLQYLLPVLVGIVASKFEYTWTKLLYLFQGLLRMLAVIYALFIIYNLISGFTPHMAATPMLFSIGAVIGLGIFFFTKDKRFLLLYFLLFLMPFVSVTRMALLVFGLIFVLHFANKGIGSKIVASFVGGVLMLFVVSSEGFQQKTFFDGEGDLSELSFDYYDNDAVNSSGRKSWQTALERGLKDQPMWGNGPRSDAAVLGAVIGKEIGEAHNDYMSVRYNYGYVGLSLLLFAFAFSFIKLFFMSRRVDEPVFQLLVLSMLTLFIPFLFFMYSDNILKYTIWFPNYFFALMGICYSIYKKGFSYE